MDPNYPTAEYLGDGVYAKLGDGHLILTTGSHLPTEASQTIYLEPEVLRALKRYCDKQEIELE